MKSTWMVSIVAGLVVVVVSASVEAATLGFMCVTNNNSDDALIGEMQLFVDVEALENGDISFTFTNIGPSASAITDVYFDDGGLSSIVDMSGSDPGVSFSQNATPHNLPGGNNLSPPFVATEGFTADSDPPVAYSGVGPGEWLTIVFEGGSLTDVVTALDMGDLRIGIHVQAFDSGGSESFVNIAPGPPECDPLAECRAEGPEGLCETPPAPELDVNLVPAPDGAVLADYVDIGDVVSEAGHNLQSWGPIVGQSVVGSGNWGGEDDCRVIWEAGTQSTSATIDLDFGTGTGTKYLALRWLDGISNNGTGPSDDFTVSVGAFTDAVADNTVGNAEIWYDLCVFNVGALSGVQTITLNATGSAWSLFDTYGQVAFSAIYTFEAFCEEAPPAGIVAEPGLVPMPPGTVIINYVDIGNEASEAGHNLLGWGPPVGRDFLGTGGWGNEDDCKVIWEAGSPNTGTIFGKKATIDLDFGSAAVPKLLALRWLDGLANDGTTMGAHDSFTMQISGVPTAYTLQDQTEAHGEDWHDLCVWYVGEICGVRTISLTATGGPWAGFNTYGQVAFSEIAALAACDGAETESGNKIHARLRLPDVAGPVNRCIRFALENDEGDAVTADVNVLFTGHPALGEVTFDAGEGNWTFLFAKDEQHVLSAGADLVPDGDGLYAESLLLLRGGDTDDNDIVDIDDVTWLIATFGDPADGGTNPWDSARDADFNNDGFVGSADYTCLATNWLSMGDAVAGRSGVDTYGGDLHTPSPARRTAKTSIAADRLARWVADRVDLNKDGLVDVQDVKRFELMYRVGGELSSKMEGRSLSECKKVRKTQDR